MDEEEAHVPAFDAEEDETKVSHTFNDEFQPHNNELLSLMTELKPATTKKRRTCHTCCQSDTSFRRNIRRSINLLNLSPRQKSLLLDRYVSLVEQYADSKLRFTVVYTCARTISTLCGILTPALVSIQPFFGADSVTNPIWWSSFGTSFALALINGYISLFKIDKRYISTTRAYYQLESEGWSYLSLTGMYGVNEADERPTHSLRFRGFMNRVEEIRKGEFSVEFSSSSSAPVERKKSSQHDTLLFRGGAKKKESA